MLNSGSYGLDMLSSAIPMSPPNVNTAPRKQMLEDQPKLTPTANVAAEAETGNLPVKPETGVDYAANTRAIPVRLEQADGASTGSSQVSSPVSSGSSPKSLTTPSGAGTPQPGVTVCNNCMTTNTPLWRRDEHGQVLCNACGLFFKLHGRSRPISLKTDVIKSRCRNRSSSHVKPAGVQMLASAKKRSASGAMSSLPSEVQKLNMSNPTIGQVPKDGPPAQMPHKVPNFYSATIPMNTAYLQPPLSNPGLQQSHLQTLPHITEVPAVQNAPEALVSMQASQTNDFSAKRPLADVNTLRGYMSERLRPHEPPSCNGLESIPPLVPPMDTSSVDRRGQTVPSNKSEESIVGRQQMPRLTAIQPPQSARDTKPTVEGLETRISELELVNDLLQQRIKDLEYSESQARRALVDAQTSAQALWQEIAVLKVAAGSVASNL